MKYYIISGEASGDLHGSNLLRALLQRDPDVKVRYWGGDRMAEVAASCPDGQMVQVRHIRDLAFMGFVEVVGHLGTVLGNISFCKRDIMEFHPDVMIFIDYPGFNLKIAKFTHQQGFRNLYYISPQIWAWKKGRIRPMRRDLDKLCYILPSERKFYAANAMPQALYVGHPLLDEVERYKMHKQDCISQDNRKKIALLPGSRKHELQKMLPVMVKLASRHPEYQFEIAAMSLIGEEFYKKYLTTSQSIISNLTIGFDRTYDLLSESWAAVVCSGTATLETALFNVPQVVCYQANKISAAIGRLLIDMTIKYISLVNLIAEAPVVTELIQGDFNIDRLDKEFHDIATEGQRRDSILEGYAKVHGLLGGKGASDRVADQAILMANS